MNVRQLRDREDVRETILVNGRAWEAAYADLLPEEVIRTVASEPTEEHVDRRFDRILEHPEGFLVAEDDDGEIRGYAYFRWGDETKEFVGPNEAGLKEIYVDPEVWGQGVGTALLERGLEVLPEGVEAVTLEMLAGNDVGSGFYEARGFEKTGTSEVEIGDATYQAELYTLGL